MMHWADFDFGVHPSLEVAKTALEKLLLAGSGAVLLAGNPGCGKTVMARLFAGNYFELYRHTQKLGYQTPTLETEAQFFDNLRQAQDDPYQNSKKPLYIIDDLGVTHVEPRLVSWFEEKYWRLMDGRLDESSISTMLYGHPAPPKKTTLITTNLTLDELSNRLGGRAFSRLRQVLGNQHSYIDLFDVPDYRTRGWV